MSEIVSIPSTQLIVEGEYQARNCLDPQHVERLRNSDPNTWPPLLVTPHPERSGFFIIIDGMHRFEAGRQLNDGRQLTKFPCIVREHLAYPDSFEANRAHPLTLSKSERKELALWLHDLKPDLSLRTIAREVGLTHPTVSAAIAKREGKDEEWEVRREIPRFLNLLRRAFYSREGGGFLGLGGKQSSYIAKSILEARDPVEITRALEFWLPHLSEGLELAREELDESE